MNGPRFRFPSLLLLATLAAAGSLSAQPHDVTAGVPVRLWGSANGNADSNPAEVELSSSDVFLPDSSSATSLTPLTGSRSAGTAAWFDTTPGTVHMEPGKIYHFLVDAVNTGTTVTDVALNMAPPLGYAVEIDSVRRQRAEDANASRLFTVRLVGGHEQAFMAAGASTQLMVGRIYWQVGLGGLRNGKAAGSLSIVDAGNDSDWSPLYTIAALNYESPSPEIIVVTKTGGLIRQVVANQAVVDIVTTAEDSGLTSTQYELRFYHPDQVTGGSDTTALTFTGQPYLTYRVEQGATSTTLKLTSTTRDTTAANSWTASAARTAVTTLARTGTAWPAYTWTRSDWNTSGQTQVAEQVTTSSGTTGDRTDTLVVQPGGGGTDASYLAREYHLYSWGEEIVSSTSGSSNPVETTFDFYDNAAEVGRHGFLKSTITSGGTWESYDYWDATSTVGTKRIGTLRYRYRPFESAPTAIGFNATEGEVTSYDFADDPFGISTRPKLVETRVGNVVTSKSETSYADLGTVNGAPVVTATRDDYSATGATLTTITRFYREDTADLFLRNQVHSVTRPDNVKVSFAYQKGDFTESPGTPASRGFSVATNGLASRIATITGIVGTGYGTHDGYDVDDLSLVSGKSTLELVIRDSRALVRRTESHVWLSGDWQPVGWVNYDYDTMGNLTRTESSNGAVSTAEYDGDQKTFDKDESGVRTDYEYDYAGRLWKAKKRSLDDSGFTNIVTYARDAAGRLITETISGTASETILASRDFDDAGRLTGETPAGMAAATGQTHAINHTYNVANRQHTVTTPDGATRTETTYLDGRVQKVEGSAVVETLYTYTVDGTTGQRITQTNLGPTSDRYAKTWSDWLGRTVKTETPGFSQSSQAAIVTENFYDDSTVGLGRLWKTTASGRAPTLYEYDELGALKRSGLDVDGTAGLGNGGADRITEQDQYVEYDGTAGYWLRSDTRTYFPGESTARTTSISRVRLTGHDINNGVISESRSWDVEDQGSSTPTATSTVTVNRTTKTVISATTAGGLPVAAESKAVNGLAVETKGSDGLVYTSDYDSLERLRRVRDPRHTTDGDLGYTVYAYKTGTTLVETVTDPSGATVVTNGYDNLGRVAWTKNVADKYTRFAYNPRGQVTRQWGEAVHPVEYEYNSLAERIKMRTWRGTPVDFTDEDDFHPDNYTYPATTGDATTWEFDAASGQLWKKTDALGRVVEFDYNARGQLAWRKWARPVSDTNSDKVQATYTYYDALDGASIPGELEQVSYNDSVTPSVTYTYDRLGRPATVADATGTRTFNYDSSSPWRLQDETLPSFFGSRVMTRLYENATDDDSGTLGSFTTGTMKGRAAGFELGISTNTDRDLQQAWSYSNQPRVAAISTAAGGSSPVQFTYAYEASSALLDGYSRGDFTVSRDYEARRDLVTRLESSYGTGTGSSKTRFDYGYDDIGRRETALQKGKAFEDYFNESYDGVYNHYVYNDRNELQSARMYRGGTASTSPNSSDELPGRRFEYRYDSIGNRKSAGATGSSNAAIDSSGTGDDDFEVNALNQYTKRENNRVWVTGTAATSANVAILGLDPGPSRLDRAWGASFEPDNGGGPAVGEATVFAATSGGAVMKTLFPQWLVPKRQQEFTYDEDGNLTNDGVWEYKYDAENRLRLMTFQPAAGFGSGLSPAFVRKWMAFKYDYSGRRVEKAVYDLDNNPTITVLARRFVYDGWNLVAELDGDGSAIQRSYTWGLDVAGGASATSSPGALLQITNYSSGTPGASYYPTYDAQGNVASLVKASDGSIAAVYEYDPFGNLIRNETLDTAVADNPFKYSTKYHDLETGLVYYGYRYYDPKNGRFLNRDPIEESGGNNLYGFCGNNGVNASDLLGMDYEITGTDSTGIMYFRGTPDASWAPYTFRGVQLGYQDASGRRYNYDYGPQIEFDWYNFNESLPGVQDFDVAFEQAFGDMRALAMADMDMADALNAIDRASEVIGHMSDGTPVTRGQGDAWEENNEALYAAAGAEMQYGTIGAMDVLGYQQSGSGNWVSWETANDVSSAPTVVAAASGAPLPESDIGPDDVRYVGPLIPDHQPDEGLTFGEALMAAGSGALEGLYGVTIGAVIESYNSGVNHMADSIIAAQEGDYAMAVLHATATTGKVAELTLTAVGVGQLAGSLRNQTLRAAETNITKQIVTRQAPGRDGATSRIIRELDGTQTRSVTHQVTKDGKVIHQHQTHIGTNGTERRFPDEWIEYPTIPGGP